MVTAIYLSLVNFDFALLETAKINGAGPLRAFIEVTWPLNWLGTASGLVLVFIPCLASALTPRFLGGPNATSFGMSLGQQFGETGTWALGSAMGVVLFAVSFLVILAMRASIDLRRSGFTGQRAHDRREPAPGRHGDRFSPCSTCSSTRRSPTSFMLPSRRTSSGPFRRPSRSRAMTTSSPARSMPRPSLTA